MTYQITYAYSGHAEILSESDDLESLTKEFYTIIEDWDLQPHDQYLELESLSGEYDYQTILEHTFNEGNWECED
jgi:hypothetical protein